MAAFIEALVGEEFELGGIFLVHPAGDLLLQEGGVGAQRLDDDLLVLAEQRLYEHGGVAQIGRHPHLGDRDEMAGQRIVMDVAAHQDIAQRMAHLLGDAEQADRAAFLGLGVAH